MRIVCAVLVGFVIMVGCDKSGAENGRAHRMELVSTPSWDVVKDLLSEDASVRAAANGRINALIEDEKSAFYRQCDESRRAHISWKIGSLYPDTLGGKLRLHQGRAKEFVLRAIVSARFWPTWVKENEFQCRRYRMQEFGPACFEVKAVVSFTEETFTLRVIHHNYATDFEKKSLDALTSALGGISRIDYPEIMSAEERELIKECLSELERMKATCQRELDAFSCTGRSYDGDVQGIKSVVARFEDAIHHMPVEVVLRMRRNVRREFNEGLERVKMLRERIRLEEECRRRVRLRKEEESQCGVL